MRVATNAFTNNFIGQLDLLQQQQNQLQTEAATGLKLTLPEDNPGGMQQVLNLQTQSSANSQYQSNITVLQGSATSTATAINGLQTISDQAGQIATEADGTASPQDLQAYAAQVSNLIQQAIQLGNTQNQGNYIFGGTATSQPPYVATTDASGNVTGVTYQGNTSVAQSEIGQGTTVTAQIPGSNTTGTGPRGLFSDSRYGADFLNHLISLQNHLLSGDTASIKSTDTPALAKDEDNILYQVSANGALQSRLQTTSNIATQQGLAMTTQISNYTSADMATTLTEFSQAQNAYKAALQSGVNIMNLSIMNYIQ
jgi:flagellar hook-associated protein 3 FlgL